MSQLAIRAEALYILHTLQSAGFEAYIVGGAVRDLLIHPDHRQAEITDYDFTTNAKPEQINALFPESYYENQFGTVSITHQELLNQMGVTPESMGLLSQKSTSPRLIDTSTATKIHESLRVPTTASDENVIAYLPDFEITTYRSKEVYTDFRRPDPEQLQWGESIEEDLARRDFTINAMALQIAPEMISQKLSQKSGLINLNDGEYQLIDPYQGEKDLHEHQITTVGEPDTRFQEDALRLLRAIRFSVQLNFTITDPTYEAVKRNAGLITNISWERIGDEFMKIMRSNFAAEGIFLLDETGLLRHILPELQAGKDVEQGGHHTTDVWIHSLDALRECPSQDPIVKLATLLHDVGKPPTYQVRNGDITFYNHEIVGSRIASSIAKRLKLSKHNVDRVFSLVRHHMFYYQPEHTDAAVRRFMRNVGLENIDDILDLREADRLGSGARKTSWRLEEMKQRMIEQLHQPMAVTDLAINGNDLMTELGVKPGPQLGEMLKDLLEKVLENPELNTKETLLQLAREQL